MPRHSRLEKPKRMTGLRNDSRSLVARPSSRQPQLAEIQQAIAHTLFRPLNSDETMRDESAAVAGRFIKPNDRLTAFERLQIYSQQYWWRILGAFGEDFRGLHA